MARSRFKPAKKTPPKAPASKWEAGDRIGKMTAPILREHRINALVGGPLDVDLFIQVIEVLEEVLTTTSAAETTADNIPAEELPDAIQEIEDARKVAVEDQNARVKEIEDKYDDLEALHASTDKEYEVEIAEQCKIIDELRKRAELAEHLVMISPEELTRTAAAALEGEKRANERAERCSEASRKMQAERDALRVEHGQLEAMIGMMRAEKPLRKRGAKS